MPNLSISYRLELLREQLSKEKLDFILVSSTINRHYLTGWMGDFESGYLLITLKKAFLITDSRYTEEAVEKSPHFELREYGLDEKFWNKLFIEAAGKRGGFEANYLAFAELKNFKRQGRSINFIPTTNLIEKLRAIKEAKEIKLLQKAAIICDQAFHFVLKNVKPGLTEREVAWKMEKFMREKGAQKNAWDPFIVAAGENSSKVHYAAGERKLKKGDQVLLDWGCYYQGYASDISRVIFLGAPTEKQSSVYNLVLEAQRLGMKQIKVGGLTKKVDLAARNFLVSKSKFSFGHGVGHGVGLHVHELPRVNSKSKEKFSVGNVVTVEPGIYEPGWGGVRIEDMVLVKEKGFEVLTKSPKELEQIIVK